MNGRAAFDIFLAALGGAAVLFYDPPAGRSKPRPFHVRFKSDSDARYDMEHIIDNDEAAAMRAGNRT